MIDIEFLRAFGEAKDDDNICHNAANEIEWMRGALARARDAMDQWLIWEPSGFAPQSKSNARAKGRSSIEEIDRFLAR